MRVSFLVLFGVIAVYTDNTDAKAVKFIAEEESNSINVKSDRSNDTACEKKTNEIHEDHVLRKREVDSNLRKILTILNKKTSKKKKVESKEVKYEEHKTKIESKRKSPAKKNKSENTRNSENRRGRTMIDVQQRRSKPVGYPPMYGDPSDPRLWNMLVDYEPYGGVQEYDYEFLLPKDILKLREWTKVMRSSLNEGLDRLFDVLERELKRRLVSLYDGSSMINKLASPVPIVRSSCVNPGDESCESDEEDDDTDCDDPFSRRDSSSGIGTNDTDKRSDAAVEFLKESLPALVRAAESILGEGVDSKSSVARESGDEEARVVEEGENDDEKSADSGMGDEAEEAVADDGSDSSTRDLGDVDVDYVPE